MFKKKSVNTEENVNPIADKKVNLDFKFFKCCSATLKKFSLIVFVMNLFIALVAGVIGIVMIGVYIGTQMMALLLMPILCVVVIAVLISRLISALIYGFAEIVEKYENK